VDVDVDVDVCVGAHVIRTMAALSVHHFPPSLGIHMRTRLTLISSTFLSQDLEIIFSQFGKVKAEIIRDPTTGDSLNYAFVEFDSVSPSCFSRL
jgi:hypothetical protein